VIVDIVVRDKKGRLETDLGAKDFQVLEDNVPQKIESFRFIGSEPSLCRIDGKDQGVALIAMVFDRISPQSCPFVLRAALKYVTQTIRPNDFVGIFGTNLTLQVFQPYTNNVELMKAGIRRALSQCASGSYSSGKASDQTTSFVSSVG
jgi:VWFA-related protein